MAKKILEDTKALDSKKYVDSSDEKIDIRHFSPIKDVESNVCSRCDECFISQTDLDRNEKNHDDNPTKIAGCNKLSLSNVPNPDTCHMCDKDFKYRVALDHHLKSVHNYRDNDSGNYSDLNDTDQGV